MTKIDMMKMNKLAFLGTSGLTLLVVTFIIPNVNASDSHRYDCESIVGCYSDGYDYGKVRGADDKRDGNDYDSTCPPNDSLTYCTGYKVGYGVGWVAASTLNE